MTPTCPKCEAPMQFVVYIKEGRFLLYECPMDGELIGVRE